MRAKYIKADIVHNVVRIEITNKKGFFSESYDTDEEWWSHNGWKILSWDDVCGDSERLLCTILIKDSVDAPQVSMVRIDGAIYWLCSDDKSAVEAFIDDWHNDIVCGPYMEQDAIWTGE